MGPEETNFLFREPRDPPTCARIDYELSFVRIFLFIKLQVERAKEVYGKIIASRSFVFDIFSRQWLCLRGNEIRDERGGYVFFSAPVEPAMCARY